MSSISASNPALHAQLVRAVDDGVARLRSLAGPDRLPGRYRAACPCRRSSIDAPARLRRPQAPLRLRQHRRPAAGRRDPRARRAAEGQAHPARVGDRVRRRRLGDPVHAGPADDRRRPRLRVARDLRPRGVLQRDQGDAQRPPGQPPGSDRGAVGDRGERYNEINAEQLVRRLGRVHRPRPAAGGDPRRWSRTRRATGSGAATSTSRPRTPTRSRGCCRTSSAYPAAVFHMQQYVPAGMDGRAHIVPPAIDPLAPKNMAFSPEDARLHLRPVRDRRRPAAAVPGLALRPVEGPARRDRRLPDRQGADARRAARARRLDGDRRSRRGGTTSTRRSPTPTAIPTSTSSTTSTTSARSRSTRSSPTRTS